LARKEFKYRGYTLEELQQMLMPHRKIQVTVLAPAAEVFAVLKRSPEDGEPGFLPGILSIEELHTNPDEQRPNGNSRTRLLIEFNGNDQALSEVLASLVNQGIPVLHFNEDSRDMEAVFMQATKGLVT